MTTSLNYEKISGIRQFAGPGQRVFLAPGWHSFDGVSPFASENGAHYRRPAVFVGDPLTWPERACSADDGIAEHEARAATIDDGDVYTTGCRSAHELLPLIEALLLESFGVNYCVRADWAICQGAAFHSDQVFAEIFALFHISGTPGELHLPRLGVKVPMSPGSWVLFDSAEPHGFTNTGADLFEAAANARNGITRFLNVGVAFDDSPTLAGAFGYRAVAPSRALRTDRIEVDGTTGALLLTPSR